MHCQNVYRACGNEATNSVPMFMGSVWMCPRCSLEVQGDDDMVQPEVRVNDYVRVPDLKVAGRVERITRRGELVIMYFSGGEFHLAFRTRDRVQAA